MSSIDKLSKSIEAAVTEIKRLRRENEKLVEKAARLERRAEEAAAEGDESQAWETEREQIRERLEALSEHLDSVLGES